MHKNTLQWDPVKSRAGQVPKSPCRLTTRAPVRTVAVPTGRIKLPGQVSIRDRIVMLRTLPLVLVLISLVLVLLGLEYGDRGAYGQKQ